MTDKFDELYQRLEKIQNLKLQKIELWQKVTHNQSSFPTDHPAYLAWMDYLEHIDLMIDAQARHDVVLAKLIKEK
jgi:hypothetical protein